MESTSASVTKGSFVTVVGLRSLENRNTVAVTINNRSQFFIDSKQISKNSIERELLGKLKSSSSPSIVLRAEEKVPIDQVVFVMNIANQNAIKVVLAVDAP